MIETAEITVRVVGGVATFAAEPRTFKTGSRGFFGVTKIRGTDGRRFQVVVSVVEIGTKPTGVTARVPAP